MILKMILKSFDFQCDFDFQITTYKMILILNHLYFGDLILILNHQHMMILPISDEPCSELLVSSCMEAQYN